MDRLKIGTVFRGTGGRQYRVFGAAQGGMGAVYFCYASPSEGEEPHRVAIKVPLGLSYQEQQLFRREGLLWLGLGDVSDSFLVPLYRVEDLAGFPALVMPYMSGGDLRASMRPGEPHAKAHAIITQVILGFKQLASAGAVHRDLKPENVLWSGDHVCLTDFGIASCLGFDGESVRQAGTLPYMSPEQLLGHRVDDGSEDLWALGVIAFELLTGVLPFQAHDGLTLPQAIVNGAPIPGFHDVQARLPANVRSFLARGLASRRSDRFCTIDEAATTWDQAISIAEDGAAPLPTDATQVVHAKTHRYWHGLFFPERFEGEGRELVRFKYGELIGLRNAENAYRLARFSSALTYLREAFGDFDIPSSVWGRWASGVLPTSDYFARRGPLEWEWACGAELAEEAVRCGLRCFVALLEGDQVSVQRTEAIAFVKRVLKVRSLGYETRTFASQVLIYSGEHNAARDVLVSLIGDSPTVPSVWHAFGLNELSAGASAAAIRGIAQQASAASLRGPMANYTRAYLWALAGDHNASVPYALKAVKDEDLNTALLAQVVGFLWNGGARADALALLDELERHAGTAPQVMNIARQLESRLAEWRRRHGSASH